MTAIERSIKKSSQSFLSVVWPVLQEVIDGDVMPIEGVIDSTLSGLIDMQTGIDVFHIHNSGIRGLASRVQPYGKSWDMFTVRRDKSGNNNTEYQKRKYAIETGNSLYPQLTSHAYLSQDSMELISVALAYTEDIIKMIDNDMHQDIKRAGNETFFCVGWWDMRSVSHDVQVYRNGEWL